MSKINQIDDLIMNLQLFATDDEDEEQDDEDIEEEDSEEEEDDNEDLDNDDENDEDEESSDSDEEDEEESDDDEDSEKSKGKKDKKTTAIINLKKELKELKAQLKEAQTAKEKPEEIPADTKGLNEYYDKQVKALVDEGVAEEIANRQIKLERKANLAEFRELAKKYPNINKYMREIVEISDKSDLSFEEVYRGRYYKEDEYSIKVKAEQNALLNKKKADSKKQESSTEGKTSDIKLNKKETEMYSQLRKGTFPNLSKKAFKKMLEED